MRRGLRRLWMSPKGLTILAASIATMIVAAVIAFALTWGAGGGFLRLLVFPAGIWTRAYLVHKRALNPDDEWAEQRLWMNTAEWIYLAVISGLLLIPGVAIGLILLLR